MLAALSRHRRLVVAAGIALAAAGLGRREHASAMGRFDELREKHKDVSLAGKQAVVVGGTSGIGMGIAVRLAEAGADLSRTTNEGTTPWMVAAGLGQVPAETRVTPAQSLAAVTFLLGRNAPVNAINDRGRSALHGAAHIRSDVIVQLLFDHGAELDVVDDRGITPLMIAEGGGHILLPGLGGGSTAELLKGLGSASFDPAAMIENYNEGRIR